MASASCLEFLSSTIIPAPAESNSGMPPVLVELTGPLLPLEQIPELHFSLEDSFNLADDTVPKL